MMKKSKKLPRSGYLEQAILSNPSRLSEGVQYAVERGMKSWSVWEQHLLHAVGRPSASFELVDAGVEWAIQIRKKFWPAFENTLLQSDCVDYLVWYLAKLGASPTLKSCILAGGDASQVTIFAVHAIRGPWPEAEAIILRSAEKESSALQYDSITKDQCDYSTCAIEYALCSLKGPWTALEEKMGSGECTSMIMLQYADEVMKGRLPDKAHRAVPLKLFEDPNDRYLKEYANKYGN